MEEYKPDWKLECLKKENEELKSEIERLNVLVGEQNEEGNQELKKNCSKSFYDSVLLFGTYSWAFIGLAFLVGCVLDFFGLIP